MGSIHPTASGRFRVRWRDQNGDSQSKTLPTRSQAARYLKLVEGQVAAGTFRSGRAGRIRLEDWIAECRAVDFALEPSTVRIEALAATKLTEALGNILLSNLEDSDIEHYIADRLQNGAAAASVAIEYRCLRKWLNRAVAKDRITKNPCGTVKSPKGESVEMRFLNMDELVALAEAMPERYQAWAYTMGLVGLRWSEAVGLRRKSVKMLQRRLEVVEQLVYEREVGFVRKNSLKTKASRRTITLGSPLLEILGEHIGKFSLPGDDGLVFPNRLGNPMGNSVFRARVFKPALKEAGLDPSIRIHDLRHTAVALAIASGAHPAAIQRRLGHSSITVTLGTYGHLFPELDEQLADSLGSSLRVALTAQRDVVHIGKAG
jgi:integrase